MASEKQLFACMLANLLDEARFFSKYPAEELQRTGAIFGLLVDQNLVQGQVMALILREITEGLQHEPESKLFNFGMEALARFRDRLSTWPELCRLLLNIPSFAQHGKELADVARAGMPTVNGVASPSEGSQQHSRASSADLPVPSQQEAPRAAAGVGTQQVSAAAGPSTADQQVGSLWKPPPPPLPSLFSLLPPIHVGHMTGEHLLAAEGQRLKARISSGSIRLCTRNV